MEKDQIIILKDRGLISISGDDSKEFLQNIIRLRIMKLLMSPGCQLEKNVQR